jgi:hypothetical protein
MGSHRRRASSTSTVIELKRFITTARRRRCLRRMKSSGSVRCTCNAGAGRKEAGRCTRARRALTHRRVRETLWTQCSALTPPPSATPLALMEGRTGTIPRELGAPPPR